MILNPFSPYRPLPIKRLVIGALVVLVVYGTWVGIRDEWLKETVAFHTVARDFYGGNTMNCPSGPSIQIISGTGRQPVSIPAQSVDYTSEILLIAEGQCGGPHPDYDIIVYRITRARPDTLRLHAEHGDTPRDATVPAILARPFHAITVDRALLTGETQELILRVNGEDVWSGEAIVR